MSRRDLAVFATLLSTACAAQPIEPPRVADGTSKPAKFPFEVTKKESKSDEALASSGSESRRKVGDFHVYQYSGSFTKEPVTLTEQVVAREGDVLVVDFVIEEGKQASSLRVRMKDDEVVNVARIGDDGETPATIADYEAMVKKTQFAPDSNDQLLGTEHTSCLVGDEQVDCDVTTYEVTVGGKQAKLSVTTSTKFPGADVGGSLVAEDGTVLYSAHLVEHGNEPSVVETFAKLDRRDAPAKEP